MKRIHMELSSSLGHFNLLEEIGRGRMGSVFRAFDPTLNREVAIKVLREDLASDPAVVTDFLRETRAAARLSHPHIVQVHFIGEDQGRCFIVMQLLRGRTLRELIETEGPLDEERAINLAIEVAEALRAAHRNQLIHGDINPANIFVTDEHEAKVLDFGLARLVNLGALDAEVTWRSPSPISMESVGHEAVDLQRDVCGLGATLYQALSGRRPFDVAGSDDLELGQLTENPLPLRELRSNVTPKTEQVVNKMLNEDVHVRYDDYDALLEDLRAAKAEATAKRLGISLQPQILTLDAGTTTPQPRRQSIVSLAVFAFVVITAVAAFVWLWSKPKPNTVRTPATTGGR